MSTMASLEALTLVQHPAWLSIKDAATALQKLQSSSGAIEDYSSHAEASELVGTLIAGTVSYTHLTLPTSDLV